MTDAADNWLRVKAMLVTQGRMTVDGVTRKVTARSCRSCGAPVLAGLDADLCAWDVRADPTPLSPLGELMALLDNRPTCSLRRRKGGFELCQRERFGIAGQPAGTQRYDVLAWHRCGAAPLPSLPSKYQPPKRLPTGSEPPF